MHYCRLFAPVGLMITLIMSPYFAWAQQDNRFQCASDTTHQMMMRENPEYYRQQMEYEQFYRQFVSQARLRDPDVDTLPVVVHIIHAGATIGSTANPTDETVKAVIEEATERFRHQHSGAGTYSNPYYGADTEVELCLATSDPNGNYTTGVTRHFDPENAVGSYFDFVDDLDSYAWDKSKYCNLFIVTYMTDASGVYWSPPYDFTIYDSPAFFAGVVNHEVGHYLSLRHTFQPTFPFSGCWNNNCLNNGDFVCDTPPKESSEALGTCANPDNSCTSDDDDTNSRNPYRPVGLGGLGDQPDMYENYMDYTSTCWDAFTEGQKTRMKAHITSTRQTQVGNTEACDPRPVPADDAGITVLTINQADKCTDSIAPFVILKNYGSSALTSADIEVRLNGLLSYTENWTGSLSPGSEEVVPFTAAISVVAGSYIMEIRTSMPNGNSDANMYNDAAYGFFEYIGGEYCSTYSDCEDFELDTDDGPGNTTVVEVNAAFDTPAVSVSQVQICATVRGDIGAIFEIFNVHDEDGVLRGQTNFTGFDCGGFSNEFCFFVNTVTYLDWVSDGTLTITFDPDSNQINPELCFFNEACVNVYVPQVYPCDPYLLLSGTIDDGVYKAVQIDADGVILAPDSVTIKAFSVELLNGFELQLGAKLRIDTTGCR